MPALATEPLPSVGDALNIANAAPLALDSAQSNAATPSTRPSKPLVDDLYMLVNVGAAIPQSVNIKNISATATNTGLSGASISLETGLRFDVGVGYEVNDWFALELASGLIWNQANGVTGTVTDTTGGAVGTDIPLVGGSGNVYSVPVMVNAQFRIPLSKNQPQPVQLLLGAGVGGIWSDANVNSISASGFLAPPLTASLSGNSWAFAYQANVGLEWALADNLRFGVRYAFLGTTELNYGAASFSEPTVTGQADIKADALYTHSLMASLRLDF